MIYTHVAAAIVAASLAAVSAWKVQDWRYGKQIETQKRVYAEAEVAAVNKARNEERILRQGVENALRESRKREIAQAATARSALAERDRLRAQLDADRVQLPSASCGSVRQYASTLSGLFDQCVGEYQGLAAKATGHASDTRTLIEAWPKP